MDSRHTDRHDELIESVRRAELDGNFPLACELSDKAVEEFSDSVRLAALRGVSLMMRGRRDEANDIIVQALQTSPDCTLAWAGMGKLEAYNGRYDDAIQAIGHAIEHAGSDQQVLQWSSEVYRDIGRYDDALRTIRSWLDQGLADEGALLARIDYLQVAGEPHELDAMLKEVECAFPESVEVKRRRAYLMISQRKFAEAKELLESAVEKQPGSVETWGLLASLLAIIGQYGRCEEVASRALDMTPCAVTAIDAMASVYRQTDRLEAEKALLDRADDLMPAVPGLGLIKIASRIDHGRFKEALSLYGQLQSHPANHIRHQAMALAVQALIGLRQLHKAEKILDQLDEADYRGATRHVLRALVSFWNRDYQGAVDSAQAGMNEYPSNGDCLIVLLHALHLSQDHDAESELIEYIAAHPPDTPGALADLIEALVSTNHISAARDLCSVGRAVFPESRQIQRADLSLRVAEEAEATITDADEDDDTPDEIVTGQSVLQRILRFFS